jgi:toxin ParE1/3/4
VRPDIRPGTRVLVVDRWLVLYRQIEDDVQVVRIVDGARDLARLDWPTD